MYGPKWVMKAWRKLWKVFPRCRGSTHPFQRFRDERFPSRYVRAVDILEYEPFSIRPPGGQAADLPEYLDHGRRDINLLPEANPFRGFHPVGINPVPDDIEVPFVKFHVFPA